MSTILQVSTDEDYTYSPDLSNEIYSFRKIIRNRKYFENLYSDTDHITLAGRKLDKELLNFTSKCCENRKKYIDNFIQNGPEKLKFEPIFILESDRTSYENIANKTKPEIACAENRRFGIERQMEKS